MGLARSTNNRIKLPVRLPLTSLYILPRNLSPSIWNTSKVLNTLELHDVIASCVEFYYHLGATNVSGAHFVTRHMSLAKPAQTNDDCTTHLEGIAWLGNCATVEHKLLKAKQ